MIFYHREIASQKIKRRQRNQGYKLTDEEMLRKPKQYKLMAMDLTDYIDFKTVYEIEDIFELFELYSYHLARTFQEPPPQKGELD
jgi:hypothetical protein